MPGYKAVTLGDEDVEWIDPVFGDLKQALHNPERFRLWLSERDLLEAVELTFRFHRVIANQLVSKACKEPTDSSWASRTIHLCQAAKRHRNRVAYSYAEVYGREAKLKLFESLRVDYPRSVWGDKA